MAAPGLTDEDLTARARIRQAALEHFAEHGFARATLRGIAATAGVSLGLVRHHFGSKEELRQAVDEFVLQELRQINDEIAEGAAQGNLAATTRTMTVRGAPYQRYYTRALVDQSPTLATLYDEAVALTEQWLRAADTRRDDTPFADVRTRAAVLTAMAFGVGVMHPHLSRVLGTDTFEPEGERLVSLALLDLYSHALVTPALAASARDGLEPPPSGTHQNPRSSVRRRRKPA